MGIAHSVNEDVFRWFSALTQFGLHERCTLGSQNGVARQSWKS